MPTVPADNPIFEGATAPSSIWSYGHRDPQGLYFDAKEGMLYETEHGPLGGDELKVVTKGGNFGWPLGRVLDVVELPSGALLILIDTGSSAPSDNGRIVKLTPRER